MVEYWHICLGSDYLAGKAKLDKADETPNEKRGHHQCCPYCRRHHPFLGAQGREVTYFSKVFISSRIFWELIVSSKNILKTLLRVQDLTPRWQSIVVFILSRILFAQAQALPFFFFFFFFFSSGYLCSLAWFLSDDEIYQRCHQLADIR